MNGRAANRVDRARAAVRVVAAALETRRSNGLDVNDAIDVLALVDDELEAVACAIAGPLLEWTDKKSAEVQ